MFLIVSVGAFSARPQVFTVALLAVELLIIDQFRRNGGRSIWWLVPIFAVWANLHGGFALGLLFCALVVVTEIVARALHRDDAFDASRVRLMSGVAVLGAAAACVNPNGPSVYRYALGLLGNNAAQRLVSEWQSPNFHDAAYLPFAALIALLVVAGVRAKRADFPLLATATVGVLLGLYAVRNIPIAGVASTPLLVAGLDGWWQAVAAKRPAAAQLAKSRRPNAALSVVALVAVGVGAGTVTALHLRDPRNDPNSSVYPVAMLDALCTGPRTNLLEPNDANGWLIYQMNARRSSGCPHDPLFIWGDVQTLGGDVVNAWSSIEGGGQQARTLLQRWHVQAVWTNRNTPLNAALEVSPGWTCVFGTSTDELFSLTTDASKWHADRSSCATRS